MFSYANISFVGSPWNHSDAFKMFRKRDFVTVVVVIYLVLLILFFANREKFVYNEICKIGTACVRFCCKNHELCTTKIIENHFNISSVPKDDDSDFEPDLKILFGKPSCSKMEIMDANDQWQFNKYGDIESTKKYGFFYDSDDYCLEGNETETGAFSWNVYHCIEKTLISQMFCTAFMVIALVFILSTVIIYVCSKSLQTLPGKCEFMLLLGLLLIHITYPSKFATFHSIGAVAADIMFVGFLMTAFWTNVLVYDVWWTFKYQHRLTTLDESKRFKHYCCYAFGLTALFVLGILFSRQIHWRYADTLLFILLFCFVATGIADVVLLVITSVKVFKMSKTSSTDHTWFEAEKERFWKNLATFLIVFVLWPAEMYLEFSEQLLCIFLVSFSSFVIFMNFAWVKTLKLFKPYQNMNYTMT